MRIHRSDHFHNEMPKGIQNTNYMTVFFLLYKFPSYKLVCW